jgi:hypothetical protein
MICGVRLYRDGAPFVFAANRISTLFLPHLQRMEGFRGVLLVRFGDDGGNGGLGVVAFDTAEQLEAANAAAAAWAEHHLSDLVGSLQPSELFPAEVLMAAGTLAPPGPGE